MFFFKAGNTLCQRYVKSNNVQIDIQIDISGMAVGEEAGFSHFNGGKDYCTLGIKMNSTGKFIIYNHNGDIQNGELISSSILWMRSEIDEHFINTYSYSTDGIKFKTFGGRYNLKWGGFRGDHIGIYNFNNQSESGHVDINWFHYKF